MKAEYYKGEEIVCQLTGDNLDSLDTNDFKVILYAANGTDIVIDKADMQMLEANKYLLTISTTVSKTLAVGNYTMEILFAEKAIWKGFGFYLSDSKSKKYVP